MSLRGRILLLGVGTAALVLLLACIPIAVLLRQGAYDDAEAEARNAAQSAADFCSTGRYDVGVLNEYLDRLNRRGHRAVAVVVGKDHRYGAPLPDDVVPPPPDADFEHSDHDADNLGKVSNAQVKPYEGGSLVRVDAVSTKGVVHVYALTSVDDVEQTVRERYLLVGASALTLLALAAVASEVTSRRLVRPLRRTADTAVSLSAGDMTARAPVEGPGEVARVAVELNALADRIDELLTQEREATADMSHRLRTPLTAVRLSVEALPSGPAKQELEAQVAALQRTLTQVIRSARRPQREGVHPHCDAVAVVRDRVAFWAPLADDQGRTATVSVPSDAVQVRASAEDLATALDALIENVIAHTPDGTAFEVRVAVEGGQPMVEVLDDGPGIPANALVRGSSDRGSTGLGLDIARSFAESVGGSLALVSSGRKHGVRFTFRRP